MKKILLLITLMIGMVFGLSSCAEPVVPSEGIETYNVISYYVDDELYLTQNIETGEKTVEPTSPSKDNYTFTSWTNGSSLFVFNTTIENDLELHANFEVVTETGTETGTVKEPVNNLVVTEDGLYTSRDEVALYIATYHKLPSNYMTKDEAGGRIKYIYTPSNKASIGGDTFGNWEGLLPSKTGRTFIELDINYTGGSRGAKRIVYSSDFRIFYTDDHYDSFLEYDKETREWKSY